MPAASARSLQVITGVEAMRSAVRELQRGRQTVGFVPTMGALHEGHLSLVDAAAAECHRVVASIFVNPTQFGPNEDFTKYPRPLERDLELLRERGCDLAFVPEAAEMYPTGYGTSVDVGPVAVPWEGAARPGHFAGVATVVLKLFECVPADRAYFGRKDYQQTLVVRRMVADLNLPVDVRVCPIVRDADGLALSSRNVYLSPDDRHRALALRQSLVLAEKIISGGERNPLVVRERMLAHIAAVGGVGVEYMAIVRDGTVEEVAEIDGPITIAIAARVGTTRLIDNVRIG
jgi:pantoate--beta-alanine ligase